MSRKYGTTSGNELESELKQVIVTASRSEFHFMSKIIYGLRYFRMDEVKFVENSL